MSTESVRRCVDLELRDEDGKFKRGALGNIASHLTALLVRHTGGPFLPENDNRWAKDHDSGLVDFVPLVEAGCEFLKENAWADPQSLYAFVGRQWEQIKIAGLADEPAKIAIAESLRKIRASCGLDSRFH